MRTNMHKRMITMGLCAMLACGMSVFAQKKDAKAPEKAQEKSLPETMKAIPAPFQSLKKNIDAKDAAAATKDAQTLSDLFKATDPIWTKAKFADAEKWSKENQAAAQQIVTAVKAGKFDEAAAPYSAVVKSCVSCHTVHREKLPDGTFKMK
jgi:cytochrome c556